ncbi:MAG: uroporphyrinogen decarboxylase family protein [Anaerolineales bacterium]|uniref:Uroporphyrinogen decarboxylase family protein n=1 Tax=Candidatus Desulfolinea nitratireducens TaxID=2841698 RepID=A0A8J6NIJ6_9CHLR|nr:uroporphyrinogen decarboxylase family protein [Candidatus Desulfolinea nitratireducens]
MNSIERTLLTLEGKLPDRVPVDLHNFLVTARLMNVGSYADYFRDGEAMAEGQIMAWKRFGHDVLIIENGTAALAGALGVEVRFQSDSAPVATTPVLKSLDEVDKLKLPDPYKDPILSELLKATRIVVDQIGDQAFVIGRADQGPFSLACELRGMGDFLLDLAKNKQPEKIEQLLDFCRQVCHRFAVAQIEQGAHATSIGDSSSGPDVISPTYYRKFAYPYVKRLLDDLKSQNILLAYHICGNSTSIIDDMVSTGAAILEIDQKADMTKAKFAANGRTTLLGPIDPSGIMAHATPDAVAEKCREALDILAPGGGFILGPGCALPAFTPDDNIFAMIETAKEYGHYTI